jgi:hypothetical protein
MVQKISSSTSAIIFVVIPLTAPCAAPRIADGFDPERDAGGLNAADVAFTAPRRIGAMRSAAARA